MEGKRQEAMKERLKSELAYRLGLPTADILPRKEVAALLGVHEKTISNGGKQWPPFYVAPLGRHGWSLYRRDWVKAFIEKVRTPEGRQPWPPEPTGREAMRQVLDHLGVTDEEYRSEIIGSFDPAPKT